MWQSTNIQNTNMTQHFFVFWHLCNLSFCVLSFLFFVLVVLVCILSYLLFVCLCYVIFVFCLFVFCRICVLSFVIFAICLFVFCHICILSFWILSHLHFVLFVFCLFVFCFFFLSCKMTDYQSKSYLWFILQIIREQDVDQIHFEEPYTGKEPYFLFLIRWRTLPPSFPFPVKFGPKTADLT